MGDSLVLSQYLRTVMAKQVVLGKCTEAQRSHQLRSRCECVPWCKFQVTSELVSPGGLSGRVLPAVFDALGDDYQMFF